jgi:transcriptional regulator with XRE-family HTH domain
MRPGAWIRAARRQRRLSQRELADLSDIPCATIARAEAGTQQPRLDTFVELLSALGYALVVVDPQGRPLTVDEEHDRLRDYGGRRFPAHLDAAPTPGYFDHDGRRWWGWERIAWPFTGEPVPTHTFWRRYPLPKREWWIDAT